MVNIRKYNICKFNNCKVIACYNTKGSKNAIFCYKHSEPDMINVISKTCEYDGCNTIPNYNINGSAHGKFCHKHRENDMVDVKNKTCEHDECNTPAIYGFLGMTPIKCSRHHNNGMIKFPTKKCSISECKLLGIYEAYDIRYCDNHKIDGSINLGMIKCKYCGLDDICINDTCNTCDPSLIIRHQRIKENRIKDILIVSGITFIHDQILESTSCGRERPDFQIDCGGHFVYIEVDENQHQSYTCECEQIRMINLVNIRGIPVTFIRYNPDKYKSIDKQKYMLSHQREQKLIEWIKYAMKHSPNENGDIANVLYLFYDDYDIHNPSWYTLI